MVTRTGLGILLCLAACDMQQTASPEPAPAPPGPPAESFAIVPANPGLVTSQSLQFEARSSSGAVVPVRWGTDNATVGAISSAGLFTAGCGTGNAGIRAQLLADTSRSATTQISVIQPAFARVQIVNLADAATHAAISLDSLSAPVEATVQIEGSACYQFTSVRLELSSGAGLVTLSSASFATPPTGTMLQTLQWDPSAYPNGPYGLGAVMTLVAGGVLNSNAIPITIRHP